MALLAVVLLLVAQVAESKPSTRKGAAKAKAKREEARAKRNAAEAQRAEALAAQQAAMDNQKPLFEAQKLVFEADTKPTLCPAWQVKEEAELARRAERLRDGRQFGEALHCFALLYRRSPTNGMYLFNIGYCMMSMGQLEAAVAPLKEGSRLAPNMAEMLVNLGQCLDHIREWETAERVLLRAVQLQPGFMQASNNLATVYFNTGRYRKAAQYYGMALELDPRFANGYYNLALAQARYDPQGALRTLRKGIQVEPNNPALHSELGVQLRALGRDKEALVAYDRAVELNPRYPEAQYNRALMLKQIGKVAEAEEGFKKALEANPQLAEAYHSLGSLYADMNRYKEAMELLRKSVALKPGLAAAQNDLGTVLKDIGDLDGAAAAYEAALKINVNSPESWSNYGTVLMDKGMEEEAVRAYRRAISLREFPEVYKNLAELLEKANRMDEAIVEYENALRLRPKFPEAFGDYVHCLQQVCNWTAREELFEEMHTMIAEQESRGERPSVRPFHTFAYPMGMDEILLIHKRYAEQSARLMESAGFPSFTFDRTKRATQQGARGGRIRIGYVSSDLGSHPVGRFVQAMFGKHDRTRFEVYVYAVFPRDGSSVQKRIEESVDAWVDISQLAHYEAAKKIVDDGVDILIEMNGHSKGGKLEMLSLRPAPVMMSKLGYPGTTGASFIDYMVSDRVIVPEASSRWYSEKQLYMPHCYQVNSHAETHGHVSEVVERYAGNRSAVSAARAALGLPTDKFIFGNFNQLYKSDPGLFTVWMNILKRVPNSVLWLLRFPPYSTPRIVAEAQKRGIGRERLVFTDVVDYEEFCERSALPDLVLDTRLYNAHTTGTDILWAGTPMITVPMESMSSRVATSLLKSYGVTSTIVSNLEEYEELAVKLATDTEALQALRREMLSKRTADNPLFDTEGYVRAFERGLTKVWQRWLDGKEPANVDA